MIKNPQNNLKPIHSTQTYILTIQSIKFYNQPNYPYISFSVLGIHGQLIKETPIIKPDSPEIWDLEVDTSNPKLMLYSELDRTQIGVRRREHIGTATLSIGKQKKALYSYRDTKKIVCQIKYDLIERKRNRFINNSDMFSDVQQQPLQQPKKKTKPSLDITYERKIFHEPDFSIMGQENEIKTKKLKNIFDASEDQTVLLKVQQASKLLEQSMRQSEEERRIFSKYLDDSTSYLNELMSNIPNKQSDNYERILDFSTINEDKNESEQQITTQQKWYTKKFQKNHIKSKSAMRKTKVQSKLSKVQQEPKKAHVQYTDQNYVTSMDLNKMISDIIIDSKQKPKQIILATFDDSLQSSQVICKIVKEDGLGSNSWRVNIPINLAKGLQINCLSQKEQFVGCIGKQEQKEGECALFDKDGKVKGIMHFKCKQINQTIVQTQQIIPIEIGSNQQSYKRPFQTLKQKSRQISEKKKEKMEAPKSKSTKKQIFLRVQNVVAEQTNEEIDTDSNMETRRKHEKNERKKLPEISNNDNQTTGSPIKKLQQMLLDENQEGQNTKYQLQQDSISKQPDSLGNKEKQQIKESLSMPPFPIISNAKINGIKPQLLEQPTKSNSKTKNSLSQQIALKKQSTMETSKQKSTMNSLENKANIFKVNHIDVRLAKPNYNGKFVKISISGQPAPYYTQTSKKLYLLSWNGKGYFFNNTNAESVLQFQLLQELEDGSVTKQGSCKINLSELSGHNQHQAIIQQKGQQIGKIAIEYEFFSKKSQGLKSLVDSPSNSITKLRNLKESRRSEQKTKYRYKSSRLATSSVIEESSKGRKNFRTSAVRVNSQQKESSSKKIQLQDYVFDRLKQKSQGSIKFRKYLGGNIIIPKAARFKSMSYQENAVGPGAYQSPSQFQRHAIQL